MNKYTTKINSITIILLILSLIFIIPINTQNIFAADEPTTATNEQVHDDCGIFPPLNVKDSIILSGLTLCLPGLLERANEYRQIKCQEVVCEYNAVVNSISPIYCKNKELIEVVNTL